MPVPVMSVAQMRAWEQATWTTGQTEGEVIRRVGQKIAARALELTRPGDSVLILAGKGHNGDDARAAEKFLADRKVVLFKVADPRTALAELGSRVSGAPALIVDGLFGIGLNRALDEGWKKLMAAINAAHIPVLAVDVPSGLDAETGDHFGAAIEAAVTLTVGAPKTGMLAQKAWPYVGRLEVVDDVGLIPCPLTGDVNWTLPGDFTGFPPRRAVAGHKGTFGHLAILAGSMGFHGAAVLAARAAQRAQPGLITVFTQEKVYGPVATQLQAVMVKVWKPRREFPDKTSAVLIGPGLAAPGVAGKMRLFAAQLWRESAWPVIADASALEWLPAGKCRRDALRVVTPHPGEAARMLQTTADQVQNNRAGALRALSRRHGDCWVVLKGHQTLAGRSTGNIFVNSSGNPHLAQGGSGDVLAGFIAGLLAQPALQVDAAKTIRFAVWQHGAAADRLQIRQPNWVVEDLPAELGRG